MKKVNAVIKAADPHWVGDGFPVRSLFSYQQGAEEFSPFLLLDYAGPMNFPADGIKRGVGEHPHRGFETVTLVYQGEVAHRDSAGNGGIIGPGDVQWMTAGSGILHEEFHSPEFAQKGGQLQMVQLWVNLPAKDKMAPPGYQGITKDRVPQAPFANGAGQLRVVAGQFGGLCGPARTFSPLTVADLHLSPEAQDWLTLPEGWSSSIVVLDGAVSINNTSAEAGQLVLLDRQGERVRVHAEQKSLLLVLSGAPLNEPIVGYGPFVMNTRAEILQAFTDFQNGQFGGL
ncbi:MAG: pirin family protein [Pseudomonadales bacterium]|nr:pirin family protein [Pseudomonadales bacterium]